jgi:hypothetical protein
VIELGGDGALAEEHKVVADNMRVAWRVSDEDTVTSRLRALRMTSSTAAACRTPSAAVGSSSTRLRAPKWMAAGDRERRR